MTLEEKSAAAIAHSGVLSRKRPYKHVEEGKSKLVDEAVEVYQIRRLLFVDFVEHVCLEAKSKSSASKQHSECTEPNGYLKMCKLLVLFFQLKKKSSQCNGYNCRVNCW